MRFSFLIVAALFLTLANHAPAQPAKDEKPAGAPTVEQIAERAKPSVVVIVSGARDGKRTALGTGFVVGEGLIATNYHVIGEARPIQVQLSDGSRHDVTAVHASDRNLDLAVIRIAKKDLRPLPLGDPLKVKIGQPIVVLGHPHNLEYSVVAGVLSGKRDIEGLSMLQLAIPIEPGNSGGPVLNMDGKVLGIVTMKSLVTANLGFAVPIGTLTPLLDRPNPIAMERWLTIGQLDKSEWKTMLGGRWRQRAGRIIVDGTGAGFGGRTFCLRQTAAPKLPFELAVSVKLDDEKGAAGLIFGGDDGDRHYGFYPTGGKMRLTRFDGPDVFTWKILRDFSTPHYHPGEWNHLKVRVDKDKISCYCNDQLVAELADPDFAGSSFGLVRFRTTVAEFKKLQLASKIPGARPADDVVAKLKEHVAGMPFEVTDRQKLEPLLKHAPHSSALLREQAKQLEKRAEYLRKLAQAVHQQRTLKELAEALQGGDAKANLARAALLVARLDNEDLDVDDYLQQLDRLARDAAANLPKDASDRQRLEALNNFLFKERGFHGSRGDYYSRSNSYLNEVLDDREGIPITLAVLYMELASRMKLRVVGLGLPGHFMVRHQPKGKGEGQIIDVFDNGRFLTVKEVEEKIGSGRPFDKKWLEQPATKKAIIVRMFHNLLGVAKNEEDHDGLLRYLDGILAVSADAHEERWMRAVLRFQANQFQGATSDVDILLKEVPENVDLNRVRDLQRILEKRNEKE